MSFSLTGIASADTSQPPNVEICMDKSHLLRNNPTRIKTNSTVPGFLQLELLLSRGTLYSISFSRCCGSAFGFQLLNECGSDPGSQTNADPDLDPGQILLSQKVEFYLTNILKLTKHTKAFLKGWNSGLFVNLVYFFAPGSGIAFPIWFWTKESQIRILHNWDSVSKLGIHFAKLVEIWYRHQVLGLNFFNCLSLSTQFNFSDLKLKLTFPFCKKRMSCLQRTSCRWCTCTPACWLSTCSQPNSPASRPSPGTSTSIPVISPSFW